MRKISKMSRKKRHDTPSKIAVFEKKPYLRCRNCGQKWYPDARKWRTKNPVEEKILRCPHCNVKNRVPRVIVDFLIKKASTDTEFGFE